MVSDTVPGAPQNLAKLLEDYAAAFPDRRVLLAPTLGKGGKPVDLTFGELARRVDRVAAAFQEAGIGLGKNVLVMVPVSVDLYVAVLALFKIGATAVLIEPSVGLSEVERCCAKVTPFAFVGTPGAQSLRLLGSVGRIRRTFVVGDQPMFNAVALGRLPDPPRKVWTATPETSVPAVITFTSGSTGRPKAMGRTHGFLWIQHLALADILHYEPDDLEFTTFPLFVLDNMASRVPTLLVPNEARGVDPRAIVRWIREYGATTLKTQPNILAGIAAACEADGIVLDGVRAIMTGGAPITPALVARLRRLVPNGVVVVAYGSTEVEPISYIDSQEIIDETGARTAQGGGFCVGRPVASLEVRAIQITPRALGPWGVDIDAITQPVGKPGELATMGRHVNETYYRDPDAEAATKFRDRAGQVWHRTGDVGYFDDQGRIWLVGRVASVIRVPGQELHPAQIEPLIEALPFVERCALVGMPDRKVGHRAVLVIQPRRYLGVFLRKTRDAWTRQILALCAERGIPVEGLRFIRTIPVDRHGRGKIQYPRLRAWWSRPWLLRLLT